MRVLVVEGTEGAANEARQALGAAGHEVTSCHDEGTAFPCHGLGGGNRCPLEEHGGVDVAVLIRDEPDPRPTPLEDGVRCALRHHVPLAIAGTVADNPYEAFAAEVATGVDDVVAAAERAARQPLAAHGGVALRALRAVLDGAGLASDRATATVQRDGTALTVTLEPGMRLEPMLLETASVRVLAAVRSLDRVSTMIDVTVAQAPAVPEPIA